MSPERNLTAMYAARDVYDELLIAYHAHDERVRRVRIDNAEEDFERLARALGYRVEKVRAMESENV